MLQVGWDVLQRAKAAGGAQDGDLIEEDGGAGGEPEPEPETEAEGGGIIPSIGFVLAGNVGLVGGSLQTGTNPNTKNPEFIIETTNKQQRLPVEEGILTVVHAASVKNGGTGVIMALRVATKHGLGTGWGMKDVNNLNSLSTKQLPTGYLQAQVDNYRKCIPLTPNMNDIAAKEFKFYSQKGVGRTLEEWNTEEVGKCRVYLTAGPQANRKHYLEYIEYIDRLRRGPDVLTPKYPPKYTMGRTFDEKASKNLDDFFKKIEVAYAAAFEAMDKDGCTVAIVPGLSTGLYAPETLSTYVISRIPSCIHSAVASLPLNNIREIYYCHV